MSSLTRAPSTGTRHCERLALPAALPAGRRRRRRWQGRGQVVRRRQQRGLRADGHAPTVHTVRGQDVLQQHDDDAHTANRDATSLSFGVLGVYCVVTGLG